MLRPTDTANPTKEHTINAIYNRKEFTASALCVAAAATFGAVSTTAAVAIGFSGTAQADPAANLPVTDQVRGELVQAGAALLKQPASNFTGLKPGKTYYAYDPNSQIYWAAAGLMPSPTSTQAQVSVQDNGSYMLFEMPAGGTWAAYLDGWGGRPDATCPVQIPPGVLSAWQWSPGGCYPPA